MVEEHKVHLVLLDFLVLLVASDLQAPLELQDLQGPSGSPGRRDLQVFVVTLALMGEWEIEGPLAPLVAQETRETQEKMGNLVQMVPLVQLEPLGKEGLLACPDSEEREACQACRALRAHQEK